jgi:hypothetical protein
MRYNMATLDSSTRRTSDLYVRNLLHNTSTVIEVTVF